jgi:2-dehydro-3-deoxy-L-rhamnonate dehydrogenase (NAD+)
MPEATPPGRHAGRVALVTGAAQGIGRAIAERLAGEGAALALVDVDPKAAAVAAALPTAAEAYRADVTDAAAVEASMSAAWRRFGRVDVVVNNAGILGPVAPTWEHTPEAFRAVVDVNLTGCFIVCRAVVPRLLEQPGPVRGRIVNIASIQAKEGMPEAVAYAASKAGVIALTKTLGKELATSGILVNCITPAAVEATGMVASISAERRAEILARIPMGRFVEPAEVAAMVSWLGGDDCTFSTGAVFDLSGGRATY